MKTLQDRPQLYPAKGVGCPTRVFARDQQHQLERVTEAQQRQLARSRQRGHDIPPLDRLLEDPV